MRKGKTISMILTIVIVILIAGKMVSSNGGVSSYDDSSEEKKNEDNWWSWSSFLNWFNSLFSSEKPEESTTIEEIEKPEESEIQKIIEQIEEKEKRIKELDEKKTLTDEEKQEIEELNSEIDGLIEKRIELVGLPEGDISSLEEIEKPEEKEEEKDISTEIPALTEPGSTPSGQAQEESKVGPPERLQEGGEYTKTIVINNGKTKVKITGSQKVSLEEAEKTKEEITEINMIVPPELVDEVANVLENEEGGVSNPGFKDNTLTYTTKYNGVPIDIMIVYNEDVTTESITKSYEGKIIYFEEGDKKLQISQDLGIKTIDYEEGAYIATLGDGSQGILTEDGTKFIYDIEEGSNVEHTLQLLVGGGTLEFHNKNTDEGNLDGTITIIRGSEKLKFYGTFDEKGMIVKDGKIILAKLENGNILTDFDKNGKQQTTYYASGSFGYGGYVFGRMQEDNSEKIYSAGYVPFAFKTESGDLIIITTKDGNHIYTDDKGNELNENSAGVKEAKAMVTKSLIGPAFYAAVEGARGGIALSNLLNSWLDIDFITNWRKKTDEFFSETVIGRVISGKWEESVCHSKIEKIPENIAVINVNNIMGFAAHVEGERSSAIKTNNQTLYFYKITFGVNPYGMGNITFELLIDGHVVDLDNDGMADKIKLEADKTYSGTGEKAVVRYKDKIYEEVCLKFYNTENLNAEFRNSLKDDKLCNKIVEVDLSSVEISEPASSTAVSSTSTGQQGW